MLSKKIIQTVSVLTVSTPLIIGPMSSSVNAGVSCYTYGNSIYCSDGFSGYSYGNSFYGNDGFSAYSYGNSFYTW